MIDDRRNLRMPLDVRPSLIELRLELDLATWNVLGSERISLRLEQPRSAIDLHALDMQIDHAAVLDGPAATRIEMDALSETVTLHFDAPVPAGEHVLEIRWQAVISESLRGLYRSEHAGQRFATTQFEATDARRAFPCFDEPSFKARYRIELVHQAGLVAISNAPVEQQQTLPDGRTLTRFATTPPISSYLVAFMVGPFEGTPETRTPTGVPVRVWLPPGFGNQGAFAHTAHEQAVTWLAEYTGVPYHFGKLDGIGLSDFEAGAMENPGAITYRTTLLAADPRTADTPTFKSIFSTVAHECTHLWWGDLVTMQWWNDLWLNESFASFVGEKCTEALHPAWRYTRDIVADAIAAYNLDQLSAAHPISMEVRNAEEASERFDAITYNKGQAVLRMIEGFVGDDAFRAGVHRYLDRFKESNATAQDFWQALDEASGQPVSRVANSWIFEPGHPLVRVQAEPTADGLRLRLSQRRFFYDPDQPPTDQRWLVPMTLAYGTDRQGARQTRQLLLEQAEAQVDLPGARWVYPNADVRGFYRYALDDASLARLIQHAQALAPEERLMLVNNQWTLARAGQAPLAPLFELLAALRGETDRAVLEGMAEPLIWLDMHAVPDDSRARFRAWVDQLFQPVLAALGWDAQPQDDPEASERRALAIGVLSRVAADEPVRAQARQRVAAYLDGNGSLDPDMATALVNAAARGGDAGLYDRYVARMQAVAATDAQEEERFRDALAAFEDEALLRRTAEACFSPLIRPQDRSLVLRTLFTRRHALRPTWSAVRANWAIGVSTDDPFARQRVIRSLANLTPPDLAEQADAFMAELREPSAQETIAQTRELLGLNTRAAQRLARQVAEALSRVGA